MKCEKGLEDEVETFTFTPPIDVFAGAMIPEAGGEEGGVPVILSDRSGEGAEERNIRGALPLSLSVLGLGSKVSAGKCGESEGAFERAVALSLSH